MSTTPVFDYYEVRLTGPELALTLCFLLSPTYHLMKHRDGTRPWHVNPFMHSTHAQMLDNAFTTAKNNPNLMRKTRALWNLGATPFRTPRTRDLTMFKGYTVYNTGTPLTTHPAFKGIFRETRLTYHYRLREDSPHVYYWFYSEDRHETPRYTYRHAQVEVLPPDKTPEARIREIFPPDRFPSLIHRQPRMHTGPVQVIDKWRRGFKITTN